GTVSAYDGRNDQYRAAHLPGVTVASYELVIYNRWGEVVFRTTVLDAGWDGIYRGKMQDSGVFVWYARYRKRTGEEEQFQKGSFMLVR
ncbi:MAG: T9SS type B sorting domain-containing protein, partial [Sphingobacteriales bacterium]